VKERAEVAQAVKAGKLRKMLEYWGKKEKQIRELRLEIIEE
jgi:hypothetical protein